MNNMKKLLALLLAIVMVVGMFPMGAMAEDSGTELCSCGFAKDHEGDCQETVPELCACGLAKDHEGDCQTCDCGLVKNHEGDCQEEEPATEPELTLAQQLVAYEDFDSLYAAVLDLVNNNLDALSELNEMQLKAVKLHAETLYKAIEEPTEQQGYDLEDLYLTLAMMPNAPEEWMDEGSVEEDRTTYASGSITLLYSDVDGFFYESGIVNGAPGWIKTNYNKLRQIEENYNGKYAIVTIWFQKTYEFGGKTGTSDYQVSLGYNGTRFQFERLFPEGPIINVTGDHGSFLQLQNVYVFNDNQGTLVDQPALRVYGQYGLLMLNGTYMRASDTVDTAYGTGILLEEKGNVELYGTAGKTNITRFAIAIDQEYGKTRLKDRGDYGYEFGLNTVDVLLNRDHDKVYSGIGLWTSKSFETLKVTLNNPATWQHGDVVFDSGYEINAQGVQVPVPVQPAHIDNINIVNLDGTSSDLRLHYWIPEQDEANDPYIRFTYYTVYNENKNEWYANLYDAISSSITKSGDTLVFYGNTTEPRSIDLSVLQKNNLVIKSAPGQNYTATWNNNVDPRGCFIVPVGYTVQLGHANHKLNGEEYGTLTFNANGKSRVVATDGTVTMPGHMVITNGVANDGNGGGIYIGSTGTLNLSGGEFKTNTGAQGNAIHVNGTLNLSGAPVFNNGQDVYLPNGETSAESIKTTKVITKAGNVTSTVPVTLGGNQYDGRDYVISGTNNVTSGDLTYFKVQNIAGKLVSRYTATDPLRNKPVLELDIIRNDLVIQKKVTYQGKAEQSSENFTFTVTLDNITAADGIQYRIDNGALQSFSGNDIITLSAGQTATIVDIPSYNGNTLRRFEITETTNNNYITSWTLGAAGHNSNKVTGTLSYNDGTDITAVCTNAIKTGSLSITKALEMQNTNDTEPSSKDYNFTVTFARASTGKYTIGSTTTEFTNKTSVNFALQKGQTAVFTDVPLGTYTVTENLVALGDKFMTPKWQLNNGAAQEGASYTGVVKLGANDVVTCINTYKAQTAKLTVTKQVVLENNDDTKPAGPYTFELTYEGTGATYTTTSNAEAQSIVSGGTFQLAEDETATIIVPAGTYKVEEINLAEENFYAPVWTGNAEGSIASNTTINLTCTNKYKAQTGSITLKKILVMENTKDVKPTGDYTFVFEGIGNAKLQFKRANETAFTAMSNNQITLAEGETVEIKGVPLNQEFTIKETGLSDQFKTSKWTANDGTETTATDFACTIQNYETATSIICTNTYKEQVGALKIKKTVSGDIGDVPGFVFHITGADKKTSGYSMTVSILGTGEITIQNLPIGNYIVTEEADWSTNYNCDSAKDVVVTTSGAEVEFTNTRKNQWLTWEHSMRNQFRTQTND